MNFVSLTFLLAKIFFICQWIKIFKYHILQYRRNTAKKNWISSNEKNVINKKKNFFLIILAKNMK